MKKTIYFILAIAFLLTGCGGLSPLQQKGAAYSFSKTGDDIQVRVTDSQEINDLDASAEPIILDDGTIICCKIRIKKASATSPADGTSYTPIDMINIIREVAPYISPPQ